MTEHRIRNSSRPNALRARSCGDYSIIAPLRDAFDAMADSGLKPTATFVGRPATNDKNQSDTQITASEMLPKVCSFKVIEYGKFLPMAKQQMNEQECFGFVVRSHRLASQMSQEELAAKAGVHRTYIGSVERGERNISLLNIHALAKALGTSAGVLLTEADKLMKK